MTSKILIGKLERGVALLRKEEFDGRGDYYCDTDSTEKTMNEAAEYIIFKHSFQ